MAMLVLLVRRCYLSRGTCCSVAYLKATHKGKSRIYRQGGDMDYPLF